MTIQNESIARLADGFSDEFVDYAMNNEKLLETITDVAVDFVRETIPIVDEEKIIEMAVALVSRTAISVTE